MKVLVMTAMYPTRENPAWGSFIRTEVESLIRAGITVDLLVFDGPNRKFNYAKGIVELRRRLRDKSVDLVHAYYGLVGMVARTQRKIPVVVTFEGDDLLGTVTPDGGKSRTSAVIAAAGRVLARNVNAAIVQSAEMAAKLSDARVVVIPHEVDFALFKPTDREQARTELGLAANKKYLLFAANPQIPVKRFPLAKAVAEYLAGQDPTIELIVACKETQRRLALYMSACDALIFPSYQEGSPNVVKQAMACNLPIVATDVGDVRQVVGGTKSCYVCKPSVTEFASCILDILQHRCRTDGRERIGHLKSDAVAAKVIGVYEQVLRSPEKPVLERQRSRFSLVRK